METLQNIEMEVQGDVLILKIDLRQRGELSKSGKSIKVATTGGNISVPEHEHIKIGVNAYTAKG